jgi:hypothetical protein
MAGDDYKTGVQNPRADWEAQTKAAEGNYEQGIQKAISAKRFGKGVARAGTEKWRFKALSVGADRYQVGVAMSEDAYATGIKPYLEVIERTSLPPRFPRGDPRNVKRVEAMAAALHAKKIS